MTPGNNHTIFRSCTAREGDAERALGEVLSALPVPFQKGDRVGVKIHWGERGNHSYLPPFYTRKVVHWLRTLGVKPFVFDTTVLYSGGRRKGADALETARKHGFTEETLGCPIVVADGMDGTETVNIPVEFQHFKEVQTADVFHRGDGFVVLSHFKGHMVAGFGGAVKNLSMGFASRAMKQRMHADVRPVLDSRRCTACGLCVKVCPRKAVVLKEDRYAVFTLEKCIGCAQCIGLCPEVALDICWETDNEVFQEKLVETAAAVWRFIGGKTVLLNVAVNITAECDCLPGRNPVIAPDVGILGGYHPVRLDWETLRLVGMEPFDKAHPGLKWRRQFAYAQEIGFFPENPS